MGITPYSDLDIPCKDCGKPLALHFNEACQFMPSSAPQDKGAHICTGCTTPAILCPMGNDDKSGVVACGSKNAKMPAPQDKDAPVKECEHYYPQFSMVCCKCGNIYAPDTPAPQPAPFPLVGVRNEKEFCRDCVNRLSCDDFITGNRIHACCDFGFEREQPAPAFTVEQIERIVAYFQGNTFGYATALDNINDPQDGLVAITNRKGK